MNISIKVISAMIIIFQLSFSQDAYMNISHQGIQPSVSLTVEPGQEITFEYGGGGPHPMTSGHGSTDSPVFFTTVTVTSSNPVAVFSLQEEGIYLFHCGTNPGNTGNWGTIIVETSTVEVPSGDIDLNGTLNYSDIVYMISYFNGNLEFSDEQLFQADVSLDETVSPLDMSLMKMAIDSTIELPYQNIDGILDGSASYELSTPSFIDNNEILVPIMVSSLLNVISMDLNLYYDQNILTLERIEFDELWDNATNTYIQNNGSIRVISANANASDNDNKLADLVFTMNENEQSNTTISLSSSQVNESGQLDEDSSVDIQLLGIDEQINPPINMSISKIYPNPFNPTTKVTFTLDDVNDIVLGIYNINGQSVRTFSNINLITGINSITWNGLNDLGMQGQSGVYFVKISSGNHSISKAITLLK